MSWLLASHILQLIDNILAKVNYDLHVTAQLVNQNMLKGHILLNRVIISSMAESRIFPNFESCLRPVRALAVATHTMTMRLTAFAQPLRR